MSRTTLLVPVVFPEPDVYPLDDENIVGLSGFDVVLFGYWEVPEEADREAVRASREPDAQSVLYELAAAFSRGGASTSVQLFFGESGATEAKLQDRIADESDVDAVLMGGNITKWANVLVPLRDDRRRADLLTFLGGLNRHSMFTLELYHVAPDRAAADAGEAMLESVRADLVEAGFAEDVVDVTVDIGDNPSVAVAKRARRHNLVVMGETGESPSESAFLGGVYRRLADRVDVPVVVLRD
ncbi:universal stress protein [Halobacterium jilantaiense]|uniref:Universal stress protein family protein n=1 Tax=Halobacterium jilantaiense TaxID=355548 RepID=A0A1I0PHI0_9EURY|nr:universal stress protein [Halobacterium jilantaiense]SEW13167.1 Universal stress protein family protein [Halobacterium jilantaiense]